MQMQQQNKVMQQQLMLLQEKQMRNNQMAGIYNTGAGGKKQISSNVNVSKPSTQKDAL